MKRTVQAFNSTVSFDYDRYKPWDVDANCKKPYLTQLVANG